jgi:phage/plasmid-associated DNA primase
MLRPRDLAESKFADDANKRTLSTLECARLGCIQEAKTDNLDFPLLKVLSGGDTVSAASMRENARQIMPMWKLFLTTNEQPVFPADAAFRGRVHLVPFRADFSEAPETTIDAALRGELPGILVELIALCPSVVRGGLKPPAAVRLSADALFAELDVAPRFQSDCLVAAPDEAVPVADVHTAAILWLQREGLEADARPLMGELRKRMGKRCAFRKVEGKSVRVFTGMRLLLDLLPARSNSGVTIRVV